MFGQTHYSPKQINAIRNNSEYVACAASLKAAEANVNKLFNKIKEIEASIKYNEMHNLNTSVLKIELENNRKSYKSWCDRCSEIRKKQKVISDYVANKIK